MESSFVFSCAVVVVVSSEVGVVVSTGGSNSGLATSSLAGTAVVVGSTSAGLMGGVAGGLITLVDGSRNAW